MNGLNDNKLRRNFIIIVVVYIMCAIASIVVSINLYQINQNLTTSDVDAIKKDIYDAIDDHQKNELLKISDKNSMQLVIFNQDKVFFSNMPINDVEILKDTVPKDNISYYSLYNEEIDNIDYDIWILLYNNTSTNHFKIFSAFFAICFLIFTILMLLLIRQMTNYILKPLVNLHSNIIKLKEFNFDDLEYDSKATLFSDEINDFVSNLKLKISDIEVTYTALEKELSIQLAKGKYQKQTIYALIHNIKTPLNIVKLYINELKDKGYPINDSLAEIEESIDNILFDIKDILYQSDNEQSLLKFEKTNVVQIFKEVYRKHNKLFNNKKIDVDIELENNIYINAIKIDIQNIFENMLSNIHTHAKENLKVKIKIISYDDKVCIKTSNFADDIDSIDFKNAATLFFSKSNSSISTGVGLYLVKTNVEKNNGEFKFYRENDCVISEILFNKIEGDKDE